MNTVEKTVSTTVGGEKVSITLPVEVPTSYKEAVEIVGKEVAFELLSSMWTTRFANALRPSFASAVEEHGPETAVSMQTEKFTGWNPATTFASAKVDPKTALSVYLASLSPKEAIQYLQNAITAQNQR